MCEVDLKVAQAYLNKKSQCNTRKINFELTFNQFKKLYLCERCKYTGVKLEHGSNWSIDRIDNNEGYTFANSVVCEKDLNVRKGSLTIKDMEGIIKVWNKKKLSKN